jgi:hypothetical protein
LKLKCDEPLSNFAFNFNMRRYTAEEQLLPLIKDRPDYVFGAASEAGRRSLGDAVFCLSLHGVNGWAAQVDSIKTRVESAFGFRA